MSSRKDASSSSKKGGYAALNINYRGGRADGGKHHGKGGGGGGGEAGEVDIAHYMYHTPAKNPTCVCISLTHAISPASQPVAGLGYRVLVKYRVVACPHPWLCRVCEVRTLEMTQMSPLCHQVCTLFCRSYGNHE